MHTLSLDIQEDIYSLVGIHCSLEGYRLAYFINKHLGYRLRRTPADLDIKYSSYRATYPYFRYGQQDGILFFLIPNQGWTHANEMTSGDGLFNDQEDLIKTYLIREFPKVDYVLKIESPSDHLPQRKILADLLDIPQIATAYLMDQSKINSKENLIVE